MYKIAQNDQMIDVFIYKYALKSTHSFTKAFGCAYAYIHECNESLPRSHDNHSA